MITTKFFIENLDTLNNALIEVLPAFQEILKPHHITITETFYEHRVGVETEFLFYTKIEYKNERWYMLQGFEIWHLPCNNEHGEGCSNEETPQEFARGSLEVFCRYIIKDIQRRFGHVDVTPR